MKPGARAAPDGRLALADIDAIVQARHADPFSVLGPHAQAGCGWWLRTMQPGAESVEAVDAADGRRLAVLDCRDRRGFFEGLLPQDGGNAVGAVFPVPASPSASTPAPCPRYRLRIVWEGGSSTLSEDAYRFGPVLGDIDLWLLGEGRHLRPFEVLGAHERVVDDVQGSSFAVWAPNARRVSVVGDFNHWDGRRLPMRLRREAGLWEIFVPGVRSGERYKYEVVGPDGRLLPLKADPYALQAEMRPATASIVAPLPPVQPAAPGRQRANALDAPIAIYEVHLGSWRRRSDDARRWLSWDELADTLVPYAVDMGFTHLELMPVTEHPFDGSWGYQPTGLYAATARHGDPSGLRRLVQRAHLAGIGVICDWVPAHFPADAHGLARFDGTALYEHADPREGWHPDWNTHIYNLGRREVANFLVGNALFWLERFGVDGLRVDAVASMLYRDYSRKPGEWVPNAQGGRENLEAIAFLRQLNQVIGRERPQAVSFAEESTAFPAVSRPPEMGGLGFHFKWNLGWMNDVLGYLSRDPIHRRHHHQALSFGLVYAFTENFVLPLSHDEVVHGKGSLLGRMPGDRWQRFANLRALYGFMWGHPGKKLLFMGGEFAQEREWNHDASLDWHLLGDPLHAGVLRTVRDLNRLLVSRPALHERDFTPDGFEWIASDDAERSLLSFVRRSAGGEQLMLVLCNFTPQVHTGLRLGVPRAGTWVERFNSDSEHYGGSNVGTPGAAARSEAVHSHGRSDSVLLTVPPLATVMLEWTP